MAPVPPTESAVGDNEIIDEVYATLILSAFLSFFLLLLLLKYYYLIFSTCFHLRLVFGIFSTDQRQCSFFFNVWNNLFCLLQTRFASIAVDIVVVASVKAPSHSSFVPALVVLQELCRTCYRNLFQFVALIFAAASVKPLL
jgi:hypothetical protein